METRTAGESAVRLAVALLAIALAALVCCARQPDRCWVCEREIHAQVRTTLTLASGRQVHACCPRCALHYKEETGDRVQSIRVTDQAAGGPLPFAAAYFVEGSDETPCLHHPPVVDETRTPMQVCYDRCMPSLIAFRDGAAARAFLADHGGTLHPPGRFPGLPPPSR